MRTPVLFLIVAVLFVNLFGFYFAFVLKQDDIRTEMAQQVKTKLLNEYIILSFSKHDFDQITWTHYGKEFLFNGKLYDVANMETSGNTVKLYVLNDDEETSLVSNFTNLMHRQSTNDGANSPVKNLLQHFLQEFTSVTYNFCLFNNSSRLINTYTHQPVLVSFSAELQSPPPELT